MKEDGYDYEDTESEYPWYFNCKASILVSVAGFDHLFACFQFLAFRKLLVATLASLATCVSSYRSDLSVVTNSLAH